MTTFDFTAVDGVGKRRRGVLEADSPRQARQALRHRGWVPLSVYKINDKTNRYKIKLKYKLSRNQLVNTTRQLADLVRVGIPIEEALASIAEQSQNLRTRAQLLSVRGGILEGRAFADSLADYPGSFPGIYRATIAAGEHSGDLAVVLDNLATNIEEANEARKKIQLALIYPVILFGVSLAAVGGLLVYVVPDVVKVFVDNGQTLPLSTRALIASSGFLASWGGLLLLAVVLTGLGFRFALGSVRIRTSWHKRIVSMPLVGKYSTEKNLARMTNTLGILTSSGVPLTEALAVATDVMDNLWWRQVIEGVTQDVCEGESLQGALAKAGVFPPIMVNMIASGERSGNLDEVLQRLSKQQQRQLEGFVVLTVGIFEPVMLLVMGGAVLFVVVAILTPIMNMNRLIA